jgi:hypothetical protein
MDISGVLSVVFLVVAVILLLPLLIGGIFVVVVVANRAEPDPSGRRPALVYSLGVAFLTLFTTLFAATAFVASLCRLIGSHQHSPMRFLPGSVTIRLGHQHPLGDSVARAAVMTAIIAIIAGVVCWLHLRAASRAAEPLATGLDPLARVRSSYVAAVSFVSVFLIIGASVVVIYDIFRGIAPGVFSSSGNGGSVEVLRSMIPALFLALAAGAILVAHLRKAPPPFQPGTFGRWFGGSPTPTAAAAVTPAPMLAAPTEVIESPPRSAPRKRAPRKTTEG